MKQLWHDGGHKFNQETKFAFEAPGARCAGRHSRAQAYLHIKDCTLKQSRHLGSSPVQSVQSSEGNDSIRTEDPTEEKLPLTSVNFGSGPRNCLEAANIQAIEESSHGKAHCHKQSGGTCTGEPVVALKNSSVIDSSAPDPHPNFPAVQKWGFGSAQNIEILPGLAVSFRSRSELHMEHATIKHLPARDNSPDKLGVQEATTPPTGGDMHPAAPTLLLSDG
ncbi:hypothetical protein UY3_13782 [Chelonia mydas]|uniref:Uncharacterized protein n=1 Tax=Chelonia mydas TaxID=8469 RepID=M7BAC1_CHEMY|nr:hypothetical protein UY3_13782 [Chelonia mydas]